MKLNHIRPAATPPSAPPRFTRTEDEPVASGHHARLWRRVLLVTVPFCLAGALLLWSTVGLGPLAPLTGLAFESRTPDPAALPDPMETGPATVEPFSPDHDEARRALPSEQEHALRIAELETRRASLEAEVEALAEARRTTQQALNELLALRQEELTALEDLQLRQKALAEEIDDLEARRMALLRDLSARPSAPGAALQPPPERMPVVPVPEAGPEIEPLVAVDEPEPSPMAADAGEASVAEPPVEAGQDAGGKEPAHDDPAVGATGKRVFIHYSTLQAGAETLARQVADRLTAQGFVVPELRAKPVRIDATRIRYFFDEDKEAAPIIQDVVMPVLQAAPATGETRIQDFTHYTPKPQPRTLELWISAAPS